MSKSGSGSDLVSLSPAGSSSVQSAHHHSGLPAGDAPLSTDQPTVISHQPPILTKPLGEILAHSRSNPLPAGTHIGQFEVIEYAGGGGMGHVYRAIDTSLGRTVALKVLARDQAGELDTLRRFHNEARSAARLNHENIAHVYCAGEDQGLPYIAFEFIEGTNVRELVAMRGGLSLAEAISYTLQVAEALAYIADRNVVHRDIKPSNILVTPEGRAKLIDMGLARLQHPDNSAGDLTASGVTLGTFDYISPEQARDPRNTDVRSDIYSLGCSLFFMLAGRPPFPEGTVLQKLLQHQGDDPPDIRQFRPDLPEEVSRVLRRMMAKSPRHRYQSPDVLIEALIWLAQLVGLQPAGVGHRLWVAPVEPSVSFAQRHLPWMAPVAILVTVVLLLHFFWDGPVSTPTPVPYSMVAERNPSPPVAPERQVPKSSNEPSVPTAAGQDAPPAPVEPVSDKPPSARGAVPAATAVAAGASGAPVAAPVAAASSRPQEVPESSAPLPPVDDLAGSFGLWPSGFDAEFTGPKAEGSFSANPLAGQRGEFSAAVSPPTEIAQPLAPGDSGRSALLIVDGQGSEKGTYATLKAACAAAVHGDVIELRYNGRREESPIELGNQRITIRAGEEFRPIVTFQPKSSDVDPLKYPRSMFTVTGSRLTLVKVSLELDVPRELPTDSWSLLEIGQADMIRLEECWLTIRNASGARAAYHPDVAFLRMKASPAAGALMGERASLSRRVAVSLVDCVVRGEATFLHSEAMQPVELTWQNGFLATTEWLLAAEGGEEAPQPSEAIQVDLKHLTAVVGRGLCQLNQGEFAAYQLPAQIRCAESILVGSGAAALIEQNGVGDVIKAQERVLWDGDLNFYEGFVVFWTISPLNASQPSEQMPFDAWRSHWTAYRENVPALNHVEWQQLPAADRPIHEQTPDDYALNRAVENPALGAANDGSEAGFVAERLPPPAPPASPSIEPSAPTLSY